VTVVPDWVLSGKVLTITGGTGSFGSTLLHRALGNGIGEVRIFSRDEKKQDDMRRRVADERVKFYLGDVRDKDSLIPAMRGAQYVFSAAALKQVPTCEFFPLEAVKTNVLGTQNVITAAIDAGVNNVVCLSTDKAAYPISAMGISKAMMERVVLAASRNTGCIISCTRYGNVMGSRGSVIPLFVEQIKNGTPMTVTDPDMTRFMMSLEDSVDLVLFALGHGNPGDLLVQKAPAATVGTLAESLKQIFSYEVDTSIIGVRHGEKTHETLLTREEVSKAEDIGSYFRVPLDNRNLNYAQYEGGSKNVAAASDYTSENTRRLDVAELTELLLSLDYIRGELSGGFRLNPAMVDP
jgi:UDP-N-acetylglucosamine 4,6-dehydratase/5-epimerase